MINRGSCKDRVRARTFLWNSNTTGVRAARAMLVALVSCSAVYKQGSNFFFEYLFCRRRVITFFVSLNFYLSV